MDMLDLSKDLSQGMDNMKGIPFLVKGIKRCIIWEIPLINFSSKLLNPMNAQRSSGLWSTVYYSIVLTLHKSILRPSEDISIPRLPVVVL
jgi:hypothetical protein